jgi:p-cumate 2,3-dioxygenase subunit alpha
MTGNGYKDLVVETPGSDFRVHRSVFTDDQYLKREYQTVFGNNWLFLGHASEVAKPGDFVTRNLIGERLILCRDNSGELRVFFNSCRHRGALVCRERFGNTERFRCIYHAWTYRNSGELVGVAERASFPSSFAVENSGLDSPRYEIYRDFVFVTFNKAAAPLREFLAPVLPYLDSIINQSLTGQMEILEGTHFYQMGGNWKLIVENSIDGYHGMAVHKTYFAYLNGRGYNLGGGLDGVGVELGNGHAVMHYYAPFGRSVARPAPVMSEEAKHRVHTLAADLVETYGEETAELVGQKSKNILIYPNLLIIDAASLQVRVLDPIDVAHTDVTAWCLAPVGEDPELRKHRIQGYLEFLGPGGFATPDDNEVIEACQEGYGQVRGTEWSILSKGMGKEVQSLTDEEQLRGFWRQWQKDIAGTDETVAANGELG